MLPTVYILYVVGVNLYVVGNVPHNVLYVVGTFSFIPTTYIHNVYLYPTPYTHTVFGGISCGYTSWVYVVEYIRCGYSLYVVGNNMFL